MKKLTFLFLMIAAMACTKDKETPTPTPPTTKCTTCTEQVTQVKSTFCGTIDAVNVFKQTLIQQGAQQGQIWKCKDN
jgi:hypothetical protein